MSTALGLFDEGMGPAAAMTFHRYCLEMDMTFTEQDLADSGRNPLPRSVYHWHDQWKQLTVLEFFGLDMDKWAGKNPRHSHRSFARCIETNSVDGLINAPHIPLWRRRRWVLGCIRFD